MTFAGIEITDSDSLDAAADLRESYDAYCARMAEEAAEENGWTVDNVPDDYIDAMLRQHEAPYDGDDGRGNIRYFPVNRDPEPPSPAAPGLAALPVCPACEGAGFCAHRPRETCWYCDGTLVDVMAGGGPPAVPVPFDRAAHCRRIAGSGGAATVAKHGRWHMATIGATGARVTIERHGLATWRGIVTGKGWTPPKQAPISFLDDLRAGSDLAALAA